jgi:hypothetical protein
MATKKFSLRVEMEVEAMTDNEAINKGEVLIKELPKMDGVRFIKYSLFNKQTKKVIKEEN